MTEPYPLSDGWRWEPLEALAEVRTGVAKGRRLGGADTIELPYLRVANVQNGYLDLREVKQIEIRRSEVERFSLKSGDILFTEGGDRDKLGRGAVWRGEIEHCVHQNHVFAARLRSADVLPEWVSLSSQTQYARDYFMDVARQTVNLASINATNLRALPVPVPPLKEQTRILAKIDGLRGERRSAIDALTTVSSLLKRFRHSVLAAAFRGELTMRDPNDAPAEALLERIRAERRGPRIERVRANGNISSKAHQHRPETTTPLGLAELPNGWCWTTVEQIADVRLGRQRSPARATGPNMVPYLRAANVTWGGLDLSDVKQMDFTPEEQLTYRLHPGDVLLSEASGSVAEVGKPALWNDEMPGCCFQNTLIRVRPHGVPSKYLYYHFLYDAISARFGSVTQGIQINHLGAHGLANWPVSLAPVEEQHRVIAGIEGLLAQAGAVERATEVARNRAEAVDQAILARAFRGDLQ